jgi:hypothetical protein
MKTKEQIIEILNKHAILNAYIGSRTLLPSEFEAVAIEILKEVAHDKD